MEKGFTGNEESLSSTNLSRGDPLLADDEFVLDKKLDLDTQVVSCSKAVSTFAASAASRSLFSAETKSVQY
jgi:hypothetical protein